ncbi:MAG: hypothetical protein K1X35_14400 [Caulobacteraceae bacterium]|nr:hypothetical protein [Caulobacteraceae bacterium]
MVKIRTARGDFAEVNGGTWSADDPDLASFLNIYAEMLPAGGESPYPDYTLAERALTVVGGEIVHADPPPPSYPGVVYSSL